MATKLITVKGTGDDHRVVLWDKDPQHPKGEAFVSNDGKEHKVAETAAVKQAIGDGRLVKIDGARVNWNSSVESEGSEKASEKASEKKGGKSEKS